MTHMQLSVVELHRTEWRVTGSVMVPACLHPAVVSVVRTTDTRAVLGVALLVITTSLSAVNAKLSASGLT
jgi:hypothetical protein